MQNFIGILSEGLRVSPATALQHGTRFGEGIYFADMASKSLSYCSGKDHHYLLLCEVALGKFKAFSINKGFSNALPAGYNSLIARGSIGPNFTKAVVLPNGVKIPTEMRPSPYKYVIAQLLSSYFFFSPKQTEPANYS